MSVKYFVDISDIANAIVPSTINEIQSPKAKQDCQPTDCSLVDADKRLLRVAPQNRFDLDDHKSSDYDWKPRPKVLCLVVLYLSPDQRHFFFAAAVRQRLTFSPFF